MRDAMVEPMFDRVLVKRCAEQEQLILLTDRQKHQICEVLAVGPGRDGCRTVVRPGHKVLVPGFGGQHPDYEFEDGSFLIQEGDIGAIVG